MNHLVAPSRSSWLSLVAETAGVVGAAIARVELQARGLSGPVRAVVQVVDAQGQVVGAANWYGDGSDLGRGASVDIGCDFSSSDLRAVAWIDEPRSAVPARLAQAPRHAASGKCDPFEAIHLDLHPRRRARPQAAVGFVPEAA